MLELLIGILIAIYVSFIKQKSRKISPKHSLAMGGREYRQNVYFCNNIGQKQTETYDRKQTLCKITGIYWGWLILLDPQSRSECRIKLGNKFSVMDVVKIDS